MNVIIGSQKVYLQVYVPDLKEFSRENLQFQNENIIIVTEPTCVQVQFFTPFI